MGRKDCREGQSSDCINPQFDEDNKRETKYNRRKRSVVYFFCPKCTSREIQRHLKVNNDERVVCAQSWKH